MEIIKEFYTSISIISVIKSENIFTYYVNYNPTYREFNNMDLCIDSILNLLEGTQKSLLEDIEKIKNTK